MTGKFLLLCTAGALFISSSAMAGTRSCAEQRNAINYKLNMARSAGNPWQVRGLENALRNIDLHCTDGHRRNHTDRHQTNARRDDIRDAQRDLIDAKKELSEARARGDMAQISAKEQDVAEKAARLHQRQADLHRSYRHHHN